MSDKNIIRQEYEKLGGPKFSENASKFIETLWETIRDNGQASVYEATILAGFDDDGDEDLFIPLCSRLISMGLLKAYTELTRDETRSDVIPNSRRDGIRSLSSGEGYSEGDLAEIGVKRSDIDESKIYTLVTIELSDHLKEEWRKAAGDAESPPPGKEADQIPNDSRRMDSGERVVLTGDRAGDDGDVGGATQGEETESSPDKTSAADELLAAGKWLSGEGRLVQIIGKGERPKSKLCHVYPDSPADLSQVVEPESQIEISNYNLKKYYLPLTDETAEAILLGRREVRGANLEPSSGDSEPEVVKSRYAVFMRDNDPDKDGASRGIPPAPVGNSAATVEEGAPSPSPVGENIYGSPAQSGNGDASPEELMSDVAAAATLAMNNLVIGRTRALARRVAVIVIGTVIASSVAYYAWMTKTRVQQVTEKIEEHLDSPTSEYRLVKRKELEGLIERAETLDAQNQSLVREREAAIKIEIDKFKANQVGRLAELEKAAYERGKADVAELGEGAKTRLGRMTQKFAVINGECEAFGRGNRVDRIYPSNLPVRVMYWIVDPNEIKISGVVAVSDELLGRADGPVTQIRCLVGRSDVWPSYGEPHVGKDGQARPLDKDGNAVETNPLLQAQD